MRRWAGLKTLAVAAASGGAALVAAPILGWSSFLTLGVMAFGVTVVAGGRFASHHRVSPGRRRKFLAEKNPRFQAIDSGQGDQEGER